MDDSTERNQGGSRKRQRLVCDDGSESRATATAAITIPIATTSDLPSQTITSKPTASANPADKTALAAMQGSLDSMRQLLTCKVCHRLMYEPYALACGHTYCYSCLTNWIGDNHKRTCPDCRAFINVQPSPSFVIREIVALFAQREELLGEGDTSEEHRQCAVEEADLVSKDRASTTRGGLFGGAFRHGVLISHEVMHDPSDGIDRCPVCLWEVEDGYCEHCDLPVGDGFSDFDGEDLDTDSDGFNGSAFPWGDDEERAVRNALFGVNQRLRRPSQSGSDSDDSSDDTGSMDGFIAQDDETIPGVDEDDDSDSSSSSESTPHQVDWVTSDEVDTAPQPSRRRGPPVIISDSEDENDSGSSHEAHASGAAIRKPRSRSARSRPISLSSSNDSSNHEDRGDDPHRGTIEDDTSTTSSGFSSMEDDDDVDREEDGDDDGDDDDDDDDDEGDGAEGDVFYSANNEIFDGHDDGSDSGQSDSSGWSAGD